MDCSIVDPRGNRWPSRHLLHQVAPYLERELRFARRLYTRRVQATQTRKERAELRRDLRARNRGLSRVLLGKHSWLGNLFSRAKGSK